MISQGLGYGLASLFTDSGSDKVEDYQIYYFQLGDTSGTHADSEFYSLSGAYASLPLYGNDTSFYFEELDRIDSSDGTFTTEIFGRLDKSFATSLTNNRVKLTLLLDRYTANGRRIREIGFFMKNPDGILSKDRPVLVSYEGLQTIIKDAYSKPIINSIMNINE